MRDAIVLGWVAFIFFAAAFFASISIVHLFQNKKLCFDKGFLYSLSACFVSVMLCLSIWPPIHRVYDDEFSFISQSVNINSSGRPCIILKGSRLHPETFASWKANPKFPGFAWLETIILFFTKDFEYSYFILNIILGALSVAVVYRIAWVWSASHAVAWWSAIFLACLPVHITYSMSAASDISGSFFFLLFLCFISEYRGLKAVRFLYAALFCGTFSICIKPFYGVFVILGLGMALYIFRREGLVDKKLRSQVLLDTACLFLPILSAIPVYLFNDTKNGAYSFSFVIKNLCTSFFYFIDYKQNTILTTLAALAAVGRSIFYKKDILINKLTWWVMSGILMFSVFCSGGISYPGYAYSDRYFLFLVFPFIFLAAKGMSDSLTRAWSFFWGALYLILLVANAFFASSHLNEAAMNGFHYKKALLLGQAFRFVPDDAYILDDSAAFITTISPKRSIHSEIFWHGDRPEKVVFFQGMSIKDSDDQKRTVMIENILNVGYHCVPLVAAPLKEAYLSTTPYLCTRK